MSNLIDRLNSISENERMTYEINTIVNKINSSLKDISNNYYEIAEYLFNLKNKQAIEKTNFKGYKNISDFAEAEFGFDKTKTYYLISIYEKFLIGSAEVYKNYKYSQLREMLSMDLNKIELCNENMTIKEIQAIKDSFSSREEKESIENTELLKNNNVIEVVFPEQKEIVPEEKVTTIIVTELPKEPIKENKTITVNVKTEQNDDYATNQESITESHDDYYKKEYLKALDLKNKADIEIIKLNSQIDKLKDKHKELSDIMSYFYDELVKVVVVDSNVKLQSFAMEFSEYVSNNKLPKKVNFFKNVI